MSVVRKGVLALLLLAMLVGLCLYCVAAQDHNIAQTGSHTHEAFRFSPASNGDSAQPPTLEKWVWNEAKEDGAGWDRFAAYGIGETVPFRVIASVPENYTQYTAYSFTITDELSEGFAFVKDSVRICINEASGADITEYFEISERDGILTVHCPDIHGVSCLAPKQRVVISYQAILDRDAVLGGSGNPGYIYMDYSTDPQWNGRAKTPMSRVFSNEIAVFSFQLDIQKVDVGTQLPVTGAEFVLLNEAEEYLSLSVDGRAAGWFANQKPESTLTIDDQGRVSVIGLRPGSYYLKEIKAPKGYHALEEPIRLQLSAEYKENDRGLQEVSRLTVHVNGEEAVASNSPKMDRVEVRVENTYSTILPPTGGIGTTIYYIIGIATLFTVALFYATKRSIKDQ